MREIRLYGHLGERFGKRFMLDVRSPSEAVRALCVTLNGFEKAIVSHGAGYHIFVGKRNIGKEELETLSGNLVIKIVPVVSGAKSGAFQIILGVVMLAAAFFTGGATLAGMMSTTATKFMTQIGISLVLGGIAQALVKPPSNSSAKKEASYTFNGPVNTTQQGNPVPLLYGELIVGSQVASFGMTTDDIPIGTDVATPDVSQSVLVTNGSRTVVSVKSSTVNSRKLWTISVGSLALVANRDYTVTWTRDGVTHAESMVRSANTISFYDDSGKYTTSTMPAVGQSVILAS